MAKHDPTLGYFHRRDKLDGHVQLPKWDVPENREPIGRLSFRVGEIPIDWQAFAKMIREGTLPNATFFVDASFLGRKEIPDEVWDALLGHRVAFTPIVWRELQPWIKNPFAHQRLHDLVVEAKEKGSDSIVFFDPHAWEEPIKQSANYYITLLCARKMYGILQKHIFEKEHGREPTDDELTRIIQRSVKDRGLTLAKKGFDEHKKDNMMADEELIICAIFNSLLTGHESYILTSDSDLPELFYKAFYLIDTHYRSMLIGDHVVSHPDEIYDQAIPSNPGLAEFFEPPDYIRLIGFKQPDIPNLVLPTNPSFVPIYCQRFVERGADWHCFSIRATHSPRFYLASKSFGKSCHVGARPMRFTSLLLAIALAPSSVMFAADKLDEAQAIREIERLGGKVERDEKMPGRPVAAVSFKSGSDFADAHIPLLKPFAKLRALDLSGTKISGTRIQGAGLKELNGLNDLTTLNLRNTRVGDGGIEQLAGLENLTTLDLGTTKIGDASLRVIGQFKSILS